MAAKRKLKRRVPPRPDPTPPKTSGAGVGFSIPIYLPVALTPPYTITVLETKIQPITGGRGAKLQAKSAHDLEEHDDPRPPYLQAPVEVTVKLKISKGRS